MRRVEGNRTGDNEIFLQLRIRVTSLEDTSKLRITIDDIVPGEYTISYNYHIDTLDENRNSRTEIFVKCNDTLEVMRNTTMMSRYRESKYTRRLTLDTTHKQIFINMFYHPKNEEPKLPDIKITNFEVVRVLPTDVSANIRYTQVSRK